MENFLNSLKNFVSKNIPSTSETPVIAETKWTQEQETQLCNQEWQAMQLWVDRCQTNIGSHLGLDWKNVKTELINQITSCQQKDRNHPDILVTLAALQRKYSLFHINQSTTGSISLSKQIDDDTHYKVTIGSEVKNSDNQDYAQTSKTEIQTPNQKYKIYMEKFIEKPIGHMEIKSTIGKTTTEVKLFQFSGDEQVHCVIQTSDMSSITAGYGGKDREMQQVELEYHAIRKYKHGSENISLERWRLIKQKGILVWQFYSPNKGFNKPPKDLLPPKCEKNPITGDWHFTQAEEGLMVSRRSGIYHPNYTYLKCLQ